MTKRILIDAAHPEEIRVVVATDEGRIEDFEVESTGKEQVKGNIYVGEITRVEPSLQAAFIDYGGNRNGFLAFSELHPQYFDLPKKERDELLKELEEIALRRKARFEVNHKVASPAKPEDKTEDDHIVPIPEDIDPETGMTKEEMEEDMKALAMANALITPSDKAEIDINNHPQHNEKGNKVKGADPSNETTDEEPRKPPIHRRYNIKDVLKEGQKIMVQVRKEERGTKGAALTTYFSLPGRYTVLMPNTPYAGGISRKINDSADRKLLKETLESLKINKSMGLIVRTAGVGVEAEQIKKDFKNLTSHWRKIQKGFKDEDFKACLLEEGSLVIRAMRDMFNDTIDEVIISGKKAYRVAKDYTKLLMPDSTKAVKEHRNQTPIFSNFDVEKEVFNLNRVRVELPSGGYLIINPTEALVAIDVNSGRATQEKNIEATALKTNQEAAEEVARQLRLRDLAGLVVIDFIDMEDRRNDKTIERIMRKAIRSDRARVQVTSISDFGLMEMSRQRLRPSFKETTSISCANCNGSGMLPSLASSALMLLRNLEDEKVRGEANRIIITAGIELALYMLNHKKDLITDLESRYKIQILVRSDNKYTGSDHRLELIKVSSNGNENSQTKEVTLREVAEDKRTRTRKRVRKTAHGKRTSRSPISRGRRKPVDKTQDSKDSNNNTDTEITDTKTKTNSNEQKPHKGRTPRRPRRVAATKHEANQANATKTETTNVTDKKSTPTKRTPKPRHKVKEKSASTNKSVTETSNIAPKAEKPKAVPKTKIKKSIQVETIAEDGKTHVATASKAKNKGNVLQRWWNSK